MDVFVFEHFARTEKGCTGTCGVVNVCLDAMEEGTLSLTAEQSGHCLWEIYILEVYQWARICALLQQRRLSPGLLWRPEKTWVYFWVRPRIESGKSFFSEDSIAVTALTQIEFLWQDLDAVQAFLQNSRPHWKYVQWVAAEVARRRGWFSGLRRAWLLTVVGLKKEA